MKPALSVFLISTFLTSVFLRAEGSPSVEQSLKMLQDADADVRITGLRGLQTSLDPRIPERMLPLLRDEGNSIRRLAARAIGSRWWQIPQESISQYVDALQTTLRSEEEAERLMAMRAIGLLKRKYDSPMFVRSPNGRWVVYERYHFPCLIDTHNETEELIGWQELHNNWPFYGNHPITDSVIWHEKEEMAAIEIMVSRRETTVLVWKHGTGVVQFDEEKASDLVDPNRNQPAISFAGILKWQGDELLVEMSDVDDNSFAIAWNVKTNTLRRVEAKK